MNIYSEVFNYVLSSVFHKNNFTQGFSAEILFVAKGDALEFSWSYGANDFSSACEQSFSVPSVCL